MLSHLFLDLNSYFASVEQQLDPSLRGRPIAVAPVHAATGSCIAASYQAKARGVKTGTKIVDALAMCPDLVLVKPRHRVYVEFHHRIIDAVERCAPVDGVHSIDEMSIRLSRDERTPEAAIALAKRIKHAIMSRVGECLTSSIGIAPNRVLAKVASDMVKPDGLVMFQKHELPDCLRPLSLRDLPGIGPKMEARLGRMGVRTMSDLLALDKDAMQRAWGSVVGGRWWHALRGEELAEAATHRRSIGHQHVLGPQRRTPEKAWEVAARLLQKAAARARSLDYHATKLSLAIKTVDGRKWDATTPFRGGTCDSLAMQRALAQMWEKRPAGVPLLVSVTLHDLLNASSTTLPLFAEEQNREELSRAVDELNARYGKVAVYLGSVHEALDAASGGIAFNSIPDLALPDTVRNRDDGHAARERAHGTAKDGAGNGLAGGEARGSRAARVSALQARLAQVKDAERERDRQRDEVERLARARRGELDSEPRIVRMEEGDTFPEDPGESHGEATGRPGPKSSKRKGTRPSPNSMPENQSTPLPENDPRRKRSLGGFGG